MADKTNRLSINAPGRFYLDDTCIDCDMCREIAPMIFVRDDSLAQHLRAAPARIRRGDQARRGRGLKLPDGVDWE